MAVLAVAGGGAVSPQSGASADDALSALRVRWRDLQAGNAYDLTDQAVATRLALLGRWAYGAEQNLIATTQLWKDGADRSTSDWITYSYRRLRLIAQAYATPGVRNPLGTPITGNAAVAEKVVTGLKWMHDRYYHPGREWTYDNCVNRTQPIGNWWDFQIGAPLALLDTCVFLHDHGVPSLPAYLEAVDHFVPDEAVTCGYAGTTTGANRVDLCRALALRGVLGGSADKVALARDRLSPVLPYVTSGDGFYADGSFIQHGSIPYTASYGAALLDSLSLLLAWLTGSPWQVTDPQRQNILDSVEKSFAPFIFNGLAMDVVSGRTIARPDGDHRAGHGIIASILRLAESASPAEAARWRGRAKGWLERDYYLKPADDTALEPPDFARCAALLNDATVTSLSEPQREHRLFPAMDRAVHRRPTWALAISMCSTRTSYYETGNGENLHGWHTSAGMTHWWNANSGNGQYTDAFWATVDPYRLPGTTVSKKALADAEGGEWGKAKPAARWAGGTTDGEFATVGQYVNGLSSTLLAKKSWFCLDDAVVCVGAGITAGDGAAVESILDNRNLGTAGTSALTVDGTAKPTTLGWSETLAGATALTLDGFGSYVLPGGATVKARREERTHAWSEINRSQSSAPVTRRFLTLWLDHGVNPREATYTYLLMPGADHATARARARDTSWLQVLANTNTQQGVSVPSLGFLGVNFWLAGTVGPVTVDQPAAVLVRERSGRATICVSDPKQTGVTVELTWQRPVSSVLSHDPSVQVVSTGAALRLKFATGTAGATHTATVALP
ncbi:polysaccharide lyase 8 family protein [Spirillospora sp. NPDC050679]